VVACCRITASQGGRLHFAILGSAFFLRQPNILDETWFDFPSKSNKQTEEFLEKIAWVE
jgi:hypothetical protein